MPKYMIVKEKETGWSYISGYSDFYNSVEAATDAARNVVSDCDSVAIAEVIKRFRAEVSIKEVSAK